MTRRRYDDAPTRSRAHRPISVVRLLRSWTCRLFLGAALAAATSACSSGRTTSVPVLDDPGAASGSSDVGALDRGRVLFAQNCATCHRQDGGGTQLGPPLTGVGAMSAHFQLSTGRMPMAPSGDRPQRSDPVFHGKDLRALVDYVASLGEGPPVPAVEPGDPALGRNVFLASCAACHSSNGAGGTLASGQAPSLLPDDATQIGEAIRLGPGTMPAFSEDQLDSEEVDAVAGYVRSLRDARAHGGDPLGGVGPTTEAVLGWLALALLVVVARLLGKRTR